MELALIVPGQPYCEKTLKVSEEIFSRPYNEALIHQVVVAYMAAARSGTHSQKTRAEVRGGGIKPWRQKGTGRARVGSIRSPLWRKGGVIFAAKPRNYEQKVNRKMYQGAVKSIFSELIRQKRLQVVEDISFETHKTREMLNFLQKMSIQEAVIIVQEISANLYLASRNLVNVHLFESNSLSPVALLQAENIIITQSALQELEERLK